MDGAFEQFRRKLANMQMDAARQRIEADWKEAFSKTYPTAVPPKLTPYDIDFLKSCNIRWD